MRFSIAAGAVELLVEVAGLVLLARQRGYDKPRIGFAPCPFRLADDPALAAPALEGSPGSVLEASRRLAAALALLAPPRVGLDLGVEERVLGQAEQEIDAVVLAPRHQRVAGKARIG